MSLNSSYLISFSSLFHSFWSNRKLIFQMTKREVIGRYRGSLLGLAWSLFNPLLMLAVYTFVFSVVFNARWGVASDNKLEFAMVLFCGMIVFGIFSECVNRAPSLVLSNVSYVKKVVFPLEILPWISIFAALFHALISMLVLVSFCLLTSQSIHVQVLLAPLLYLPLIMLTMGISWMLSAFSVFVRDIVQSVGLFTTIMMFLSPVFYPASSLPESFRWIIEINPLTYLIEESRRVMLFGYAIDWAGFGKSFVICFAVFWLGFISFQRLRKGFSDVL